MLPIAKLFGIFVVLLSSAAAYSSPYNLSFGGRLTETNGTPVKGPIDIALFFHRSEAGNNPVSGITVPVYSSTELNEGVFQVVISLNSADFHTVFNGTDETWIEVHDLTNGHTYPRQRFSAAPYALKVPVDISVMAYNANGQLTIAPGASGQILTTDGSGNVVWDNSSGTYPAGDAAKVGLLTVTGNTNLDTMRSDVSASKGKTDYLTVTAATDLDQMRTDVSGSKTKTDHLTVTAATNLDQMRTDVSGSKTKTDHLTVTAATDLDDIRTKVGNLQDLANKDEVGSNEITNNSIMNTDINSSAAIAGTKISPDFGSQNIATTGSITGGSIVGDGSNLTNTFAVGLKTYSSLSLLPATGTNGHMVFVEGNSCVYRYSSANTRWEVFNCNFYPDWRRSGDTEITFYDQNNTARIVTFTINANGLVDRHFLYGADYTSNVAGNNFFIAEGSQSIDDNAAPIRLNGRWQRCGYAFTATVCLPYLGMIRDNATNIFEPNWYRSGSTTHIHGGYLTTAVSGSDVDVDLTHLTTPATTKLNMSTFLHAGTGGVEVEKWYSRYGASYYRQYATAIFSNSGDAYRSFQINDFTLTLPVGVTRGYRYKFWGGSATQAWDLLDSFEEDR